MQPSVAVDVLLVCWFSCTAGNLYLPQHMAAAGNCLHLQLARCQLTAVLLCSTPNRHGRRLTMTFMSEVIGYAARHVQRSTSNGFIMIARAQLGQEQDRTAGQLCIAIWLGRKLDDISGQLPLP